ncbi:hypothetical protein PanWU01x14_303630 [Parasponia andersonii]|uniref:Uncharacterized protein n=1 Tax=Parasponia andersonii TaxID=3476 RepID=A0A2P5ASW1_PARAD|nr:hypothetical protein PanWU01x14_303630 [Parasponia andersonii]
MSQYHMLSTLCVPLPLMSTHHDSILWYSFEMAEGIKLASLVEEHWRSKGTSPSNVVEMITSLKLQSVEKDVEQCKLDKHWAEA